MPTAPPSRCHCGSRATNHGRCDRHQPIHPTGWQARPSTNARTLTSSQRQQLRQQQLARSSQCQQCGSTTRLEADHIIPIADGGSPTNPANLQTLCRDCHRRKTRAEQDARRRRRRASRRR